jgi:molybdopterin converting factor small subunit
MTAIDRPIQFASATAAQPADTISIEVRFFTSLTKYTDSPRFAERIDIPPDTTVGDLVERYGLPISGISRILCNGRDMNPGSYIGRAFDLGASLSDGDVIAFTGPMPDIPGYRSAVL